MTQVEFEEAARALASIQRDELVSASIIADDDDEVWNRFRADPYRWLIGADDAVADRLWTVVEGRLATQAA